VLLESVHNETTEHVVDEESSANMVISDDGQVVLCLSSDDLVQDSTSLELIHPESVIAVESQSITESVPVGGETDATEGISEESSIIDYKNRIAELSNDIETLQKEYDDFKIAHENEIKQFQDQLEILSSEAKLEEKLKDFEYSMEEKYTQEFRSKEAEHMDKFEKDFKKYKMDMENYIKHKEESIKAEKDQMFIITMQKVKKDYEKRLKKELVKLGRYPSKDSSDVSEGHTEEEGGQDGEELTGAGAEAEAEKQILKKENEVCTCICSFSWVGEE